MNKNLIPGAILVGLGCLFLAENYHVFNIHWGQIWRLWPIILILLGVNIVLGKRSTSSTWLTIAALCIAIPMVIIGKVKDRTDHFVERFDDSNGNMDIDSDDEENDDADNTDNDKTEGGSSEARQRFTEPLDGGIKTAKLVLEGGAAKFRAEGGTTDLIEVDAKLSENFPDYALNKKVNGTNAELELKPKGDKEGHFELDEDDFGDNKLNVKLNRAVEWDIDLKLGAGKADFDLSEINVKNLNLETGVTSTEVKLGDMAANTTVKVKSGVAEVEIKVPNNVGCLIKTQKAALNIQDFDGFTKSGSNYQSPDYDKATKKITIEFESGISKLKVKRY